MHICLSRDFNISLSHLSKNPQISYNDVMPKQMCSDCANEVLISYRLRKKAISSEKIMQNMIQRQEQEDKVQTKDIESCKS